MKQVLIKNGSDKIVVIFCGWSCDANCFDLSDGTADFLILNDYRSPDFDVELVKSYKQVCLFAWSLGVWAADNYFNGVETSCAVAYNGTVSPVNDEYGIPVSVFDGTIANFSERSLYKFRRRMCGANARTFFATLPGTSPKALLEELVHIRNHADGHGGKVNWTVAYYGTEDKIFPAANQLSAWKKKGIACLPAGKEHFEPEYMKSIMASI